MKNLKVYAAMAMTTMAIAGTAVPAQAAGSKIIQTEINGKKCYVHVIASPGWCLPGVNGPGASENPEIPETPVQPETPETPEVPEQPEAPALPEVPNQPETPEIPESPTVPETPEIPDEDSSYAARILRLVNEERAKAGLSALTLDTGLTAAGNVRAKEIVSSFSHTRPNGTSFSTAIREQGVSFRGAGENIAWGQKSPEEVMDAWMNSPGHRANILNEKYTRIGVGHYQNGTGTNYWVQLFAY